MRANETMNKIRKGDDVIVRKTKGRTGRQGGGIDQLCARGRCRRRATTPASASAAARQKQHDRQDHHTPPAPGTLAIHCIHPEFSLL